MALNKALLFLFEWHLLGLDQTLNKYIPNICTHVCTFAPQHHLHSTKCKFMYIQSVGVTLILFYEMFVSCWCHTHTLQSACLTVEFILWLLRKPEKTKKKKKTKTNNLFKHSLAYKNVACSASTF